MSAMTAFTLLRGETDREIQVKFLRVQEEWLIGISSTRGQDAILTKRLAHVLRKPGICFYKSLFQRNLPDVFEIPVQNHIHIATNRIEDQLTQRGAHCIVWLDGAMQDCQGLFQAKRVLVPVDSFPGRLPQRLKRGMGFLSNSRNSFRTMLDLSRPPVIPDVSCAGIHSPLRFNAAVSQIRVFEGVAIVWFPAMEYYWP